MIILPERGLRKVFAKRKTDPEKEQAAPLVERGQSGSKTESADVFTGPFP